MTQSKARKRAARERAAATGERYVVARRAVDHPSPIVDHTRDRMLHRLIHRVPGVPEHGSSPHASSPHGASAHRNRQHQHRPHQHGEPRILNGWQRRIARLLHAR